MKQWLICIQHQCHKMKVKEKSVQKQESRRDKNKGQCTGLQPCRTAEQMLTEEHEPWVCVCQQREQPISLGCACPKDMQFLIKGYCSHPLRQYITDIVQ